MELEILRDQVRQLILEKIPLAAKRGVQNGDHLLESGILDSLGVLDVVNEVEGKFQITLNDEELVPENFQTIDNIASFVNKKIREKSASQSRK